MKRWFPLETESIAKSLRSTSDYLDKTRKIFFSCASSREFPHALFFRRLFESPLFFSPDWLATLTPARLLRNLIDARFARFLELVGGRLVASLLFPEGFFYN